MRLLVSVAYASLALLVADASAQDFSACREIENGLERLSCYDRAAGRTPKLEVLGRNPDSNWEIKKEISPMTDDESVYLRLRSNEPVNCSWNKNNHVVLLLRCLEKTTSLYFNTDCHMTSGFGGYGTVEYRIDSEPARKIATTESTDNRALGLWSGRTAIPFIKQLFGKSKLTARMTPFNENPFIVTFDIAGLETAIEPLRKACSW